MKHFFAIALAVCTFLSANAQSEATSAPTPDARLLAVYPTGFFTRMQRVQPETLAKMNFSLDHAYKLEKAGNAPKDLQWIEVDLLNFNLAKVMRDNQLRIDETQQQTFGVNGTDKILVLLSQTEVDALFNAQKNK